MGRRHSSHREGSGEAPRSQAPASRTGGLSKGPAVAREAASASDLTRRPGRRPTANERARIAGPGRESVDFVNRPGPGEGRLEAEHPGASSDAEAQNSGRSMEEEIFLQSDADDAGALPNQRVTNRGPDDETPAAPADRFREALGPAAPDPARHRADDV